MIIIPIEKVYIAYTPIPSHSMETACSKPLKTHL